MHIFEIIALVFIVITLIKLLVISFNPKAWYGPANPLMKLFANQTLSSIFSLFLGGLVLMYLLTKLNIVGVFAVLVFAFLLLMLTLSPYINQMVEMIIMDSETGKGFFRKNWLSILVWLILIFWVLWDIFFLSILFTKTQLSVIIRGEVLIS